MMGYLLPFIVFDLSPTIGATISGPAVPAVELPTLDTIQAGHLEIDHRPARVTRPHLKASKTGQ